MLLILIGIVLLLIVQTDFIITALSGGRQGAMTDRLSFGCWRLLQRLHNRFGGQLLHAFRGLIIMSFVTMTWLLLTALAWLLILVGGKALVMQQTGEPANWVQSLSYVGNALSTMGAANAVPSDGWWGIWGAVAAANGFVLLTLSVTYILTVMQTVASGRSFALLVNALDATSPSFTSTFAENLAQLVSQLTSVPMALYYSSVREDLRLTLAISRFAQQVAVSPELWQVYAPIFKALCVTGTNGKEPAVADVRDWAARFSLTRDTAKEASTNK